MKMKTVCVVLLVCALAPSLLRAQTGAINGFCDLGGKQSSTSSLNSTNYLQGVIPNCTVTVYLNSLYSVSTATYTNGGSVTGSAGQTCTATFSGGTTNGTGTIALTGTNTIQTGTAFTVPLPAGHYTTPPTTATLSSGTATCSGTANIAAIMTPALATIYSDKLNTPLTNPFKATVIGPVSAGQWLFYAASGAQGYDVMMSGGNAPNTYPYPLTLTDILIPGPGGGGTPLSLTTNNTSGPSTLINDILNVPIYQGQLTLTTLGTSGPSTLIGDILNIPNYATGGGGGGGICVVVTDPPFNAACDGSTDDTAEINAALASGAACVALPPSNNGNLQQCNISSTLTVSGPIFLGSNSEIEYTGGAGNIFSCPTSTPYCSFYDLQLQIDHPTGVTVFRDSGNPFGNYIKISDVYEWNLSGSVTGFQAISVDHVQLEMDRSFFTAPFVMGRGTNAHISTTDLDMSSFGSNALACAFCLTADRSDLFFAADFVSVSNDWTGTLVSSITSDNNINGSFNGTFGNSYVGLGYKVFNTGGTCGGTVMFAGDHYNYCLNLADQAQRCSTFLNACWNIYGTTRTEWGPTATATSGTAATFSVTFPFPYTRTLYMKMQATAIGTPTGDGSPHPMECHVVSFTTTGAVLMLTLPQEVGGGGYTSLNSSNYCMYHVTGD